VHLARILHFETHAIVPRKLELGVYKLVGTVVADKDIGLAKVSSGGKGGIASFSCLDVTLNRVLTLIVEFCGGGDVRWEL
jgi:hypothetical protein